MKHFVYAARTDQGHAVQGQMTATSIQAVLEHLRGRALVAVDIHPQTFVQQLVAPIKQLSSSAPKVLALRTLATLLSVGVPLRSALEIVLQATRNRDLHEALAGVRACIEAGESLGNAMQQREDFFSPLTIALVRAGERGGTLCETLERHAHNLDQQLTLQRRLITMLIYPAFVLCTALGLMLFLVLNVLPLFSTLFTQLHVEQPPLLRLLIRLPQLLTWQALALIGSVIIGVYGLSRRTKLQLQIPLVSHIQKSRATASFARALASLLTAGVPLPDALHYSRPIVHIKSFQQAIDRIGLTLRDGNSLVNAVQAERLFDPLFVHFLRVGEESGTLDAQLLRMAEWCERDINESTTRAITLLEPLMILGIGSMVAGLVFSIFVPLYTLIGSIR